MHVFGAFAAMLAVLGAIDSLLTSLVADSLTSDFHDSDKELRGGSQTFSFAGGTRFRFHLQP